MILLDPDLSPDPSPRSTSAKRTSVLTPAAKTLNLKIPTARTLARFLKLAQESVRLRGHVTVLLTTDAAVKDLNKRFRGKNKATDVLSFPAEAMPGLKAADRIAGDLAISVDTARKHAEEQGHSLLVEIKVLMLHGLLHLAGFDHEVDEGQMARREQMLRAKLGLPLGLIERTLDTRVGKGYGPPTHSPEKRRMDGARDSSALAKPKKRILRRAELAQDDKKKTGGRV